VTGQPPQMHPFSSVIQPLFPIIARQKPPFSPHSTQLGHFPQMHKLKTICFLCSISSGLISKSPPPKLEDELLSDVFKAFQEFAQIIRGDVLNSAVW
jgi:hypothetical protein